MMWGQPPDGRFTTSMVHLTQFVAVVDDDESVRRALKRLLHSVGVQVETFSSGEAFLDTLSPAT
jgi:FixJ family two-component response regulator